MSHPIASYVYRSASGLRIKERFENKSFLWWTYDPLWDQWFTKAPDSLSTLYLLDQLAIEKPETVWVTEGEKDTESVRRVGLPAVTSGGWSSWRRHHSEQLHECGCQFCIVTPDRDPQGDLYAYAVARNNFAVGIQTKIVRLPGLTDHQDVTDYLDAGHAAKDLLKLAKATPFVTQAELPPEPVKSTSSRSSSTSYVYDTRLSQFFIECLKLPPKSRGKLRVLCPFHPDSATLSLSLDLDHGLFYCHGCGEKGTVVAFFMKWHQLHGKTVLRTEALRRLQRTYC